MLFAQGLKHLEDVVAPRPAEHWKHYLDFAMDTMADTAKGGSR